MRLSAGTKLSPAITRRRPVGRGPSALPRTRALGPQRSGSRARGPEVLAAVGAQAAVIVVHGPVGRWALPACGIRLIGNSGRRACEEGGARPDAQMVRGREAAWHGQPVPESRPASLGPAFRSIRCHSSAQRTTVRRVGLLAPGVARAVASAAARAPLQLLAAVDTRKMSAEWNAAPTNGRTEGRRAGVGRIGLGRASHGSTESLPATDTASRRAAKSRSRGGAVDKRHK